MACQSPPSTLFGKAGQLLAERYQDATQQQLSMILQCLEESRDAIQAYNDLSMAQAEIETVSSAKPVAAVAAKKSESQKNDSKEVMAERASKNE